MVVPTSTGEGLVDKLGHLVEMQGDVGLGHVQQLQPLVLDTKWFVELLHTKETLTVCRTPARKKY